MSEYLKSLEPNDALCYIRKAVLKVFSNSQKTSLTEPYFSKVAGLQNVTLLK